MSLTLHLKQAGPPAATLELSNYDVRSSNPVTRLASPSSKLGTFMFEKILICFKLNILINSSLNCIFKTVHAYRPDFLNSE